jgi:hypothetical protein
LEDARFTIQDIYLLFIDFTNAFGSIDHARLLAIMNNLGYPEDAITLMATFTPNLTPHSQAHILVKQNQ